MINVNDALSGVTRLGLDTDVVIFFVQAHPLHDAQLSQVFARIAQGNPVATTSVITITETLVLPFRMGDYQLEQDFRELLLNTAHIEVKPIDAAIAEKAADLRARYRMKTPDALQAATAIVSGCDAFLTNNGTDFRRVLELNVLVSSELEVIP